MALNFRELLLLSYNGPQGNIDFPNAMSASIEASQDKQRVQVMKRGDRNIGMTSGPKTRTLQFEIKETTASVMGVDWELAFENNETFAVRGEKGDGGRVQNFFGCEISSISEPYDTGGGTAMTVSVEVTNSSYESS